MQYDCLTHVKRDTRQSSRAVDALAYATLRCLLTATLLRHPDCTLAHTPNTVAPPPPATVHIGLPVTRRDICRRQRPSRTPTVDVFADFNANYLPHIYPVLTVCYDRYLLSLYSVTLTRQRHPRPRPKQRHFHKRFLPTRYIILHR